MATITPAEQKLVEIAAEIMGAPPIGDDITFQHVVFCSVGLPRSKPEGDRFERRSGSASLLLEAGTLWNGKEWERQPLPYGTKPRLLNLYITREYIRTGNRTIELCDSISGFLRTLGIGTNGGRNGAMTAFRQQAKAFAAARLMLGYTTDKGPATLKADPIQSFQAWLAVEGGQRTLWPGTITLSEGYAKALEGRAVPLDSRAVRALQGSALALDVYGWLANRLHRVERPVRLPWASLKEQFGQEISDPRTFKRNMLGALRHVLTVYPAARVDQVNGGLMLFRSPTPVPKLLSVVGG